MLPKCPRISGKIRCRLTDGTDPSSDRRILDLGSIRKSQNPRDARISKGDHDAVLGPKPKTSFYPGYFAAVMATGIVSTALFLYHRQELSDALMVVTMALYLFLWYRYVARFIKAPSDMWADLTNPATAFGFFTIVAGSNVLGVRFVFAGWVTPSVVLGAIALVVWMVLFYTVMTVLIIGPAVELSSVNGGWLIAVVAEQSIATYLAAMIDVVPHHVEVLFLLSSTFWAMGLMFYVIFIGLIIDRLLFQRVSFNDLQPPYWINMGATAITVLASSRLLSIHVHAQIFLTLRPFLEGVTLMLWAWGSWWIPLLVILGVWKYWRGSEKVEYHPSQWSIVFPLGMYAAATTTMSKIHGFKPLHWVGGEFLWIALGAWILVAALAARQFSTRSHRWNQRQLSERDR